MATNGGIIGKSNRASFGKCTVTSTTATGCLTLQPGTRQIQTLLVSGGGGGGKAYGGGGGGGGYRCVTNIQLSTNSVSVVVGGGGAGAPVPSASTNPGTTGCVSSVTGICGTFASVAGGGGGGQAQLGGTSRSSSRSSSNP